ncbi:hypothetical protein [Vampirovibrio chlorellavorus]|uniref:hypothetical protein n=1 Tax=Vampirovibrio chlorellavorus TaxID=758823 RepID=UPI0026F2E274|nr:hypothetical protein [Vampirovibrio chlorellavorus]
MTHIALSDQKPPPLNPRAHRAFPGPVAQPPAAAKGSERPTENKKRSLKADLAEVGVLVVGIFSDAVLFIGYPLILLCQKFKKWLWKQ